MALVGAAGAALAGLVCRLPPRSGRMTMLKALGWAVRGQPVRSRLGVRLVADPGDKTNAFCLLGLYDTVPAEVEALRPGMCFIDVGANCGLFSVLASRRVGPGGLVVAFEPSPREFRRLVRNLEINGCSNVLAVNMAVCDSTRRLSFALDPGGHTGVNAVAEPGTGNAEVFGFGDAATLAPLIDGRPTVIKIDTEGFEAAVIEGLAALIAACPVERIVVEINPENMMRYGSDPADLYRRLRSLGFLPRSAAGASGAGAPLAQYDEVFVRTDA